MSQVKIYAAIFAHKRQLSELQIQLTYFQLETQETKILNQQFKAEELNIFLQTTIVMYLKWLDKIDPNSIVRVRKIYFIAYAFCRMSR